jgi:GTPase SAR1 family protein
MAGKEYLQNIGKLFFQSVSGVILLCEQNNSQSIENLSKWDRLIKESCYNIPILIVMN